MSDRVKIQIDVICDPDENMGYINTSGMMYECNSDSIFGDQVCDALYDTIQPPQINPWSDDGRYLRRELDRKIEDEGFDLVSKDQDCANRLKRFCKEYFGRFHINNIDPEIVFYDSLNDCEHQRLEKAVIF